MQTPKGSPLQMPITGLPGVGPERAAQLARLGVATVEDLLLHAPRAYEDRRRVSSIAELALGAAGTARGRIVAMGTKTYRQRSRSVFEFVLEDGTGRLHCRWWNQPYRAKSFTMGDEVLVHGKVKPAKPKSMDHPETEILEAGDELGIHVHRIVPIYPLTEGMPQRWLRRLLWQTLERYGPSVPELWEELPRLGFPSRDRAVQQLHFPEELAQADQAKQRLALDELLELQVALRRRWHHLRTQAEAFPCGGDNRWVRPFLRGLSFTLTGGQTRVLRDLRADLSGTHPMRRLLQGDVGSGKTVVAACCALMTLECGFNVALMAPTEILAEQHYQTFTRWFQPLGIEVELNTASRKTRGVPARVDRAQADLNLPLAGRAKPALVVGTHALIEEAVELPNLGLVIIDEQHKFGVAQREKLLRKGRYAHLLVMTATPIPRTLGLTLYGDLEVSIIDELPAGRGNVHTYVRSAAQLPKVYTFLKQQIDQGRQAYLVFPRVEEADTASGLKAVTQEYERLQAVFAPRRVGLIHGRLRMDEKERIMTEFRAGAIHVLLATSVIEVGLDVPNATVMVIENADRFGLAQLHQLRGRIGRGAHESYCVLIAEARTEDAKERLQVLSSSNDGFAIAEADLRLRGPGEFLGQNQSGLPAWRFANLIRDRALIEQARALTAEWVAKEPAGS